MDTVFSWEVQFCNKFNFFSNRTQLFSASYFALQTDIVKCKNMIQFPQKLTVYLLPKLAGIRWRGLTQNYQQLQASQSCWCLQTLNWLGKFHALACCLMEQWCCRWFPSVGYSTQNKRSDRKGHFPIMQSLKPSSYPRHSPTPRHAHTWNGFMCELVHQPRQTSTVTRDKNSVSPHFFFQCLRACGLYLLHLHLVIFFFCAQAA
jgi:hypothetical protein